MINIIATIPASLLPLPPPSPANPHHRLPPRSNSYLLLPRAGAIMINPMPFTACIEQAGLWNTAATLEVREDGFLMDDIRTLARSGRGTSTAAAIAHLRLVNPEDYTEENAITSLHGDTATALYEEPVSIADPMPGPRAPAPARNAWTGTHRGSAPRQATTTHGPTASPLSSDSYSPSPAHPRGNQNQTNGERTPPLPTNLGSTLPPSATSSDHTPTIPTARQADTTTSNPTAPLHTNWFANFTNTTESDPDSEQSDTDAMDTADTTQRPPVDPSPQNQQQPTDPTTPSSLAPIQSMITAAIAEAQRAAREEYQRELERLSQIHQQETQALRAELQNSTHNLRQDILTQTQQAAQQQQ